MANAFIHRGEPARPLASTAVAAHPRELGPAQLLWLRDKVAGFSAAHDQAERAQIHADAERQRLNSIQEQTE